MFKWKEVTRLVGMYQTDPIVMRDRTGIVENLTYYHQNGLEKSNYLEQHGIKGQKWGVRRYQNPDGSLTKAGEARYAREKSKTRYKITAKSPFEKQREKLAAKEQRMTEKEEIIRRKNQLKERQANLKNQGKSQQTIQKENKIDTSKKKSAKDLTDQELREFVSRYELEKKYNQIINSSETKKGSAFVKDMVKKSASIVAQKYTTKAMEAAVEAMLKRARRGSSGSGES